MAPIWYWVFPIYSDLVIRVTDWNQLPAVVVEQESSAAFKNQLDRLAPVARRMP